MKKAFAATLIALAILIGALTLAAGVQLAYDVARTHPSPGVLSDAVGLLPLFGLPLIVILFLAVIGRELLKSR